MSMKAMQDLKDLLCSELDQIARKGKMGGGDLEIVHKLTDTIKNIDKIMMLEDDGYGDYEGGTYSHGRGGNSYDGDSMRYGDGSSYANRGKHWVRGHYSRDGGMPGDYSGRRGDGRRRDARGRYSRDDGKEHMISQLEDIMDDASDPQTQQAIQRCIEQLENA